MSSGMIRIPNASPSGIVTNFETKCTEFFHPRVLVYVLRNRAAYLARNRAILSPKFGRSRPDLRAGTSPPRLSDPPESESTSHLSRNLEDELTRLSMSLISCSGFVNPQSAATVLLSLAKLNYCNRDLIDSLLESFKFDEATPKSVSLILFALSKFGDALNSNFRDFFRKCERYIRQAVSKSSCQDLTMFLVSIAKIAGGPLGVPDALSTVYPTLLNRVLSLMELAKTSQQPSPQAGGSSFSVFELSNILESMYATRNYDAEAHSAILDELAEKLPSSPNYINDVFYVMGLFHVADPVTYIDKKDRRQVLKLSRKFSESVLIGLTDKLALLTLQELSKLAHAINTLRLWTEDEFVAAYSAAFMAIFNRFARGAPQTRRAGPIGMSVLAPVMAYYNRRYEAAVNRECLCTALPTKGADAGRLNEVSNLCGFISETLQTYVGEHHPHAAVEDLMRVSGKLRLTRSLNRIRHNYKLDPGAGATAAAGA